MDTQDFRDVAALLRPLARKLMLVATRVVVTLVKDDSGVQSVQATGLKGETFDGNAHMQPGGMTHVPLPGAEGVFLTVGGVRDDGVMICVSDRRHRPKNLSGGETALYNEGTTQSVIAIRANGDVEVSLAAAASLKIGAATESFLKGDTFVTALTTWLTAHDVYIKIPVPTGPDTATYTAASTAFVAALTTSKSLLIKGI